MHTRVVTRYRVAVLAAPPTWAGTAQCARRTVESSCAHLAACELATPYVEAGLVVDWTVRRAGLGRFGRRWMGRFTPDDDDGAAGVREPRRPRPPAGSAAAIPDPPTA
jgi:hypothetical protein